MIVPERTKVFNTANGGHPIDTQAKSIKNGGAVMMIMSVFALVLSLMWIFITEIMFVSDFTA
jgi:hypothetical protein